MSTPNFTPLREGFDEKRPLLSRRAIVSLVLVAFLFGAVLFAYRLYERQVITRIPSPTPTGLRPVAAEKNVVSMRVMKFAFSPTDIRIRKGLDTELTIRNEDSDAKHGFFLPAKNINQVIGEGEEKRIVIPAFDKEGEYYFISSVYSGQGFEGMKGRLIVE
jgi:plastocyanin